MSFRRAPWNKNILRGMARKEAETRQIRHHEQGHSSIEPLENKIPIPPLVGECAIFAESTWPD